ncbi:MAG: helix-turn-helix transcriptional regulator [Anaerolineae bacterium]|nr:helix-turn-helix transcriptional regulator [Anaerolineae bacterium]
MSNPVLPLHEFKKQQPVDVPFRMGQIEKMSAIARTPTPHRHTFYEIFWVTGGSGSHIIDFEPYAIQPDTLYFITPGQVHSWDVIIPTTGYALLFTEDFLPISQVEPIHLRSLDFFHHVNHRPVLHIAPEYTRPFHDICQNLLQEYMGSAYGRSSILQSQLHLLLVHAQRHYASSGTSAALSNVDRLVENYMRLIDMHFRERQQVHEYAGLLGVTPGHLTDTTRERTGMPASQFIYRRITMEAKRLLAYSEQTVAEIGFELNFDDPSYFTRFFRRECGITPTEFRRNIREKYQPLRNSSL